MNRARQRSSLWLCVAAVVLAAAGAAQATTYVTLSISGGFNMNCVAGPIVASQACFANSAMNQWVGNENTGFGLYWGGSPNSQLPLDTSANDGLSSPNYIYEIQGYGSFTGSQTITGSQGLPENGIINSKVDSRTYMIASVSGNALLPGDWTEPVYVSASNGQTIPGFPLAYGANTYTASSFNTKRNAIVVGNAHSASPAWSVSNVVVSVQAGYYSDINFVLAGGVGTGGCQYSQIWATYADDPTHPLKLFDWGNFTGTNATSPTINSAVASSSFINVYQTGALIENSAAPAHPRLQAASYYLWEFAHPLTLDPARQLVSISISGLHNTGNYEELAVFGATATAAGGSSYNGSEVVNSLGGVGGGVSVTNSGPYTDNQTFTATATPSTGWTFAGWSITGPSTLSSSSATSPTVTVHGNFTLTAFFQLQMVPLDISTGFNMSDWVGPLMFDYCVAQQQHDNALYLQGPGGLQNAMSMLAADDPSPLPSYNGTSFTGTQCTPSNGVVVGADRTYYIASVGGNALLPGDWTETSNSGLQMNTIIIGQYVWVVPAVTASVTPGYYSNVNFLLGAGSYYGANQMQIIAGYSDSTSGLVYDFGTFTDTAHKFVGPNLSSSVVVTGFHNAYTAGYNFNGGTGATGLVRLGSLYLWEFSSPLTLNSTKILVSLTFSNYSQIPANQSALAIYGATARAAPTVGSLTLTTSVSPPGAGTITPPGGTVPGNFTFPVTATPTNSNTYVFDHWTMSDSNAIMGDPLAMGNPTDTNLLTPGATNALTLNNANCTLTAYFRTTTGYTYTNMDIGGTNTLNPSGPYSYGQTVGITASAYFGWYFMNWTATNAAVWNETSSSTSITVYDSFDLAAVFGEIPLTVTASSAPAGAGAVYYDPWEPVYITDSAVQILAVPEPGWTFVKWTTSGANVANVNAASTTMSVTNNVWLTASFTQNTYKVTVQQPGGGSITLAPSQSTYLYSTTTTITAAPTGGNTFANWVLTGPGQIASYTSSKTTLTVQGTASLTALWGTTATLTVTPQNGLGWTVSPAGPYTFGQVVTVTATSLNPGYVLQNWVLSGGGILTNSGALTTYLTIGGNDTLSAVYTTGSYVNNISPTASDSNVGSIQSPLLTISKAVSKVKTGVTATIVVCQGTYRGSFTLSPDGTAANPITLKANPGDRVIVTAADVIPMTGSTWTQCTAQTASNNPNFANIYYTDITWLPTTLTEDQTVLPLGRFPTGTWYPITSGGGTDQLCDTVHLTQTDAHYFDGAGVIYYGCADGSQFHELVTGYNPNTHTITTTITIPWGYHLSGTVNATGGDFYFIDNHVHLLSGPGQWAYQTFSTTSCRVFVWPAASDRPDGHLIEAHRWATTGVVGTLQLAGDYWTVDGLEVTGAQVDGIAGQNNICCTVQNCVVHDNDWNGIVTQNNPFEVVQHNLILRSGLLFDLNMGGNGGVGIANGGTAGSINGSGQVIFENEIGFSGDDAMYWGAGSATIVGNYIHDDFYTGHNDGIQFTAPVPLYGFTISSNLFEGADDAFGANDLVYGISFQNNVALWNGGDVFQGASVLPFEDHNTILYPGYGANVNCSPTVSIVNNLFYVGQHKGSIWFTDYNGIYSDYNLGYFSVTETQANLAVVGYTGTAAYTWTTFADYQAYSGLDTHSIALQDPKFTNVAKFVVGGVWGLNNNISASLVMLDWNYSGKENLPYMNTGDWIEVGGDGVPRQIVAIDTNSQWMSFTPSDAKFLDLYHEPTILYWGSTPGSTHSMDLTLLPGSPAINAAMDGTNIGSTLNVHAMQNGQLDCWNGNFNRVIPIWPPAPINLTSMSWSYMSGGTPHALTESTSYSSPNMTGFKIAFSAPLYAPSCSNTLALKVVDSFSTSYQINTATLDSTGTILTITLTSGALAAKPWYEVILNPAIMGKNGAIPTIGTNGAPVTGVKSVRFTVN